MRSGRHALMLLIGLRSICAPAEAAERHLMTVLGPVPAAEMGTTLQHEHILVDFIGAAETGYHRWDRNDVIGKALPHLNEVKALGCSTFFECTPAFVGRDPHLLKTLAEKTGLNIVTCTGLYGARDNLFIPEKAREKSAEQLAAEWIAEFNDGIEGTGIRPGFIKLAVERDERLSPLHEKLVRAAALTHLATGLTIMSHTGSDTPAFNQLDVLESMDVPAGAFVWTHAQGGTWEGWIKAAKMGAWVSIDNIKTKNAKKHADSLVKLKEAGVLHRFLISHDSGWYRVGEPDGGTYNGYTAIFKEFIPALEQAGFTEADIHQLLVVNPREAFCISR